MGIAKDTFLKLLLELKKELFGDLSKEPTILLNLFFEILKSKEYNFILELLEEVKKELGDEIHKSFLPIWYTATYLNENENPDVLTKLNSTMLKQVRRVLDAVIEKKDRIE